MKKILILLMITFFSLGLKAQLTPIEERIRAVPANAFVLKNLFSPADPNTTEIGTFSQVLESYQLMTVDDAMLNSMVSEDIAELEIKIMIDGNEEILQLVKNDVVDANTAFTTQQNAGVRLPADYSPGAYYCGIIKNHPHSVVGISFFQNNIIGVIGTGNGNYVLGKTGTTSDGNQYILYNDKDMLQQNNWTCGDQDNNRAVPVINMDDLANKGAGASADQCVRIYLEVDYQMYLNQGSNLTNTFNYATGLFNVVTTLYQNESISIACSGIGVWDHTDPYASDTSTTQMLDNFSINMNANGFDGSLAHLLSGRYMGGGIAYVDVLCCSTCMGSYGRTAVSADLIPTITPLPTYSWNVNCVTHEIGHNLGSPHTHACVWNNNGTPIDACGPVYGSGYTPPITFEGPCSTTYVPTNADGGTIMSYCHLGAAGIKFSNGFGPQPGNLIRGKVANAACLLQCDRTCPANVTFPFSLFSTYSKPLTESQTWIKSNGTAIINPSITVKLDANPVNGYVELNPGLYATPNTNGVFIAQALDGCGAATPQRPANPTPVFTPSTIIEAALTAYPNPATNRITIKVNLHTAKEYRIDIIDINSRVIKSIVGKAALNTVDISEFNQGLYLIRTNIDDHNYSCKFLKTN
jgi:hypothetical protein